MKIAVVYNRESENVINLFGLPNREKYGKASIKKIVNALKKGGHQVKTFEGDKNLISNLESFMPSVLKGEIPGLAFNLSYGIQGHARYTHVPGILEMVGIPYLGSNPLAHSLALDKVVAKMIFRQNGLPTPDFAVLNDAEFETPDLDYPLIVKPKNEAVSMGISIVNSLKELREAANFIFEAFKQPALVEQFIEGQEINVGLLGNNPPEAMPPCEIVLGRGGPPIYTIDDKKGISGRNIDWICPAAISSELTEKALALSKAAFSVLGCYDMARVDMKIDSKGGLFILELNSLPSLGEHGSYTIAAKQAGLDFAELINRMVEVASARYFGTPAPPDIQAKRKNPKQAIFSFITQHRDQIERTLEDWTSISSRTPDQIGNKLAISKLDKNLKEMLLRPVEKFTDNRSVFTWETKKGFENGTLFVGHMDVPLELETPSQNFRREPEWLYGEGIGTSRAPLVTLLYTLRSLRHQRWLQKLPIGVLYYLDEGRDARFSSEIIKKAAAKAKRVFILRPGNSLNQIIIQRRGQRKYQLIFEGTAKRLGKPNNHQEILLWVTQKLQEIAKFTNLKEKVAISATEVKTFAFPMLLPHRITVDLLLSYLDSKKADEIEEKIRGLIGGSKFKIGFEIISDRSPMSRHKTNLRLAKSLADIAEEWDIPMPHESSIWPSVAGLVPARIPVACGIGPAARDLYTPQESINRTSLVQRMLVIAQFLAKDIKR